MIWGVDAMGSIADKISEIVYGSEEHFFSGGNEVSKRKERKRWHIGSNNYSTANLVKHTWMMLKISVTSTNLYEKSMNSTSIIIW